MLALSRSSLGALALLPLATAPATAAPPTCPAVQRLADAIVAANPGVIDVIVHASPAAGATNVVVAAHLRHAIGEASGEDDLGVMRTGAPLVEVQKDGVRLGVLVQLRDRRHRAIGALEVMYGYRWGDDVEARVRRTFAIRDRLANRPAALDCR